MQVMSYETGFPGYTFQAVYIVRPATGVSIRKDALNPAFLQECGEQCRQIGEHSLVKLLTMQI